MSWASRTICSKLAWCAVSCQSTHTSQNAEFACALALWPAKYVIWQWAFGMANLYIYLYIYTYFYIYNIFIYIRIFLYIHIFVYIIYIYTHIFIYNLYIFLYIHIFIYIIYIYTYIFIYNSYIYIYLYIGSGSIQIKTIYSESWDREELIDVRMGPIGGGRGGGKG